MSVNLDNIDGPSEADLLAEAAEVAPVADLTVAEWAALLDEAEPVIDVRKVDEDYWNEDENVHDDRYDGTGVPSWSAWA